MITYVLDIHGKPLMPTRRCGHVRRLLRDGRARVVSRTPFTIRLTYESTAFTQGVTVGFDPGSKIMGISTTTEKEELLRMEVQLRDDVVKNVSARREARRTRRARKTRHRAARFDNRKRPGGWLAPSTRQRVDSHLAVVRKVCAVLPVSRIVVETAQFDMQKIKNPDIAGEGYRHGEQAGWKNVREYVLYRDGHRCRCCAGRSGDPVLEVHHLESRKTGGDAPGNLVTLCRTCHKKHHAGEISLKLRRSPSLRDAAAVNIYRWRIYDDLVKEYGKDRVSLIYGYTTKDRRISLGLPKTSETDAFCIAGNLHAKRSDILVKGRCVARHSRSLHDFLPKEGGLRRSCVASHWITVPARGKRPAINTRLQRFDTVRYKGRTWLIAGSSNGRPILRDINWNAVGKSPTVNHEKVKFLNRKHGSILLQIINNQHINTCET